MTFIFIGRSGSGKGTQASLLIKHLEAKNSGKVFCIETGRYVREFLNRPTYAGKLAKEINEQGGRQPDFLAVYLWADLLLGQLAGGEHLVFDGTPRSLVEAQALDTALTFFKISKPKIIFLDASHGCVSDRLRARGRHDDHEEGIKQRLAWYDRDVAPVVDYYREHKNYDFVSIDAEGTIEAIHDQIKQCCV